ncbi:MAG: hypothetical protein LBT98_02470 [Puniceicoccales bacterium]|nr:hypothetical protein [Puniceicoccales bacterium]
MAEPAPSIALYHGEDEFLVERALLRAARQGNGAHPPEVLRGSIHSAGDRDRFLQKLAEALATPPLLNPGRALWIKDLPLLSAAPPAGDDGVVDAFFSLLDGAVRGRVPLFLSASPVDRRLRAFKRLVAHPAVANHPVEGGPAGRERFLAEDLERRGLAMAPSTRLYLLELVGGPARLLAGELDKLELALHPRRTATERDVAAICCEGSVENCFALTAAYFERSEASFVRELRRFLGERGEPRVLLATLQGHCRTLLQLKALEALGAWPASPDAALERAKRHCPFLARGEGIFAQNSFYLRRLTPQLRLWSLAELERARRSFLEIFLQLLQAADRSTGWWLCALALPRHGPPAHSRG